MSVFTAVTRPDLLELLDRYSLGQLVDFTGIHSGVENTNYFVTTTQGEYVLTLFETVAISSLPFFLGLTKFLADSALPCARPIADRSGELINSVCGRPAALVQRLPGTSAIAVDTNHCASAGETLARIHCATKKFSRLRGNNRGKSWRRRVAQRLRAKLSLDEAGLINKTLNKLDTITTAPLPCGIVHGDMFRDNVLFQDQQITGVIDFYYACFNSLLYDLAITVNDWCSRKDGSLDHSRAHALVSAYAAVRPVEQAELRVWVWALRAAALRFWLSRLHDVHYPRNGQLTQTKAPQEYQHILQHRWQADDVLPLPQLCRGLSGSYHSGTM